jgi:tetratricopeptide (TPR) repeat protein
MPQLDRHGRPVRQNDTSSKYRSQLSVSDNAEQIGPDLEADYIVGDMIEEILRTNRNDDEVFADNETTAEDEFIQETSQHDISDSVINSIVDTYIPDVEPETLLPEDDADRPLRASADTPDGPITFAQTDISTDEIITDAAQVPGETVDEKKRFEFRHEFNETLMEGITFYKNMQYEDAVICFKKLLKLDPDFKDGYQLLGNAYYRCDLLKDALSSYEQHKIRYSADPTVLENLGLIYTRLGVLPLAVKEWQSLLKSQPDRNDIKEKLARLLKILEEKENKQTMSDTRPVSREIRWLSEEPELQAEPEPELNPIQQDLLNYQKELLEVGIRYYNQKRYPEAIQAFQYTLDSFPELKQVRKYLANTYYRMGNFTEAATIYDEMARETLHASNDYENLGFIRARQGEFSTAVRTWKKAIEQDLQRKDLLTRVNKISELL